MSSSNSSVESLLKDAEKLVSRLKEHGKAADCLLGQADGLHKTIKAKSAFMKEMSALNEVARHRPRSELVIGIQMENQQIRRLQAENRDLRMLIDEHQSAVDVIMTKYREQMALIVAAKKMNKNGSSQNEAYLDDALLRKRRKLEELGSVLARAIDLDEGGDEKSRSVIEKLLNENRILRETLSICEREKRVEEEEEEEEEVAAIDGGHRLLGDAVETTAESNSEIIDAVVENAAHRPKLDPEPLANSDESPVDISDTGTLPPDDKLTGS